MEQSLDHLKKRTAWISIVSNTCLVILKLMIDPLPHRTGTRSDRLSVSETEPADFPAGHRKETLI